MMPLPLTALPRSRCQRRLLSSCAVALALVALGQGGTAQAQVAAIQGTGTVVAGSAVIDSVGGTTAAPRTNVQVNSSTAVINWTPTDATAGATPIDFLPVNGLAYFNSPSDPNFTVLNRVETPTTRPIGLNGEVMGALDISGTSTPAGNVWFYSPTGIVAGTGSHFVANGLILTANDIPFTPGATGGIDFGSNGEIQFTAASGSQASVTLLPGASIQNSGTDAYTLLVAPGIVQGGTIELDGSVGLVAAEQASIIVQNGLFNIDVQVGTTVANAIVHTGSTGAGPAAATLTGPQHVVVLATPQNTAITMLLSGNLGATAANATAADRSVTLSGGYDYNDLSGGGLAAAPDTTTPANIQIGASNFNANLVAQASGSITGSPSRGTAIDFLGDASLTAGTAVNLTADLDETITASQGLFLQAPSATLRLGTTNAEAGAGTNAARVDVAGDLTVSANSFGFDPAVDAVGGTATIALDAGAAGPQLTVGGSTTVTAAGQGAEGPSVGGNGVGGTAQIVVNGGTLSLQGTSIIADGTGSGGLGGGSGTGGLASFTATDPQSYAIGDLTISANGTAGDGFGMPSLTEGTGTGGTAQFINQGTAAVAADSRTVGYLTLQANGDGGFVDGVSGQNAVGGLVQFSDLASGANGHAHLTSVYAYADGLSAPAGSGALIQSAGGTTAIDYDLFVDIAGTATVSMDGNGSIATGNYADIFTSLGDVLITHTNQGTSPVPTISGGYTYIQAFGDIDAGPGTLLSSTSSLDLIALNGNITADSLTTGDELGVHALGNVTLTNAAATTPATVLSDGSLVGGHISLTAGADPLGFSDSYMTPGFVPTDFVPADIVIGGNVSATALLEAYAGRDILGSGSAPALLQGAPVQLIAGRDISGANLGVTSQGDLNLRVGRNLLLGAIDIAGAPNMIDTDGTILQAGQIAVPGSLQIGDLTLRGPDPGLISAVGDLTIGQARTSALNVSSGGVLTVDGLSAYPGGASASLTASAPTIALSGINVSGNVSAITTSGAGGVTLGAVQAGGMLLVDTPGTLTVNGAASGATVNASSGDVAITSGGSIGTAGTTTQIVLANNSAKRSYYGGSGNAAGYSIGSDEIGHLYAGDITLIAPLAAQGGQPDVTIGDMTVTGGQLGASGTFAIQTPGSILIDGAVRFTGLGSGNTFMLYAGPSIILDNQLGSVDLRGSGDTLAGTIDFSAGTIMAASSAAQSALAGLTDPAAINTVLGSNDGAVRDLGVLRADAMRFTVANALYIQNTGAGSLFPFRRGFAVGAGGLTVNAYSSGNAAPLVVINGQATSGSTVVSGLDAIPLVEIDGQPAPSSTAALAGSTINGCDFTDVGNCHQALPPEFTPTRDRIEQPVDATSDPRVEKQAMITTGVELEDVGLLPYEPLIDEPVTGSGNDDLWEPGCDPAKGGDCPATGDESH